MEDGELRVVEAILALRPRVPPTRACLVAVSGIDASGKGYLTAGIVARLRERGVRAVGLNVDGWLNLPDRRFRPDAPAEHFYEHAIRFEEMFERLVLPLRASRAVDIEADFTEETATEYRKHGYRFENVEVIVLEGIFLLKRSYRALYDLAVWVECTFETALERALARGQEGLPPEATIRAYQTIYFPAQRVHFLRDGPRAAAQLVVANDHRLVAAGQGTAVPR